MRDMRDRLLGWSTGPGRSVRVRAQVGTPGPGWAGWAGVHERGAGGVSRPRRE
jgi:hypothetical protein